MQRCCTQQVKIVSRVKIESNSGSILRREIMNFGGHPSYCPWYPFAHRTHLHFQLQTEEPDSSLVLEEETATTAAVSVPAKQHLLNLNVTRCPICQKFVLDLPQHISLTHHQPRPASAMVLPTAAAAAAINLVKKEDNSNGAPINLSVR